MRGDPEQLDPHARRQRLRLEIAVQPASQIRTARHALEGRLQAWGCRNAGDVALVLSELVTNAVVHTGADAVAIVTHHADGRIRLEVHDTAQTVPHVRQTPHASGAGGYGLKIVAELSDSWGWQKTATGKTVWSVVVCGH